MQIHYFSTRIVIMFRSLAFHHPLFLLWDWLTMSVLFCASGSPCSCKYGSQCSVSVQTKLLLISSRYTSIPYTRMLIYLYWFHN